MAKRSRNKGKSPGVSRAEPSEAVPGNTVEVARVEAPANVFSPGASSPSPYWLHLLQALVLVVAGWWIYAPVLRGDWVWDDNSLITDNPDLRSWAGLANIWLGAPATDYWPLTWTVLWVEWHLWADHPFGYHVVSLMLHLSSGLLLWRVLARLGLRWSWLGGLLFVVHPLAVESVAWISEIKNTLSLPLMLLSLDAWLDAEEGKRGGYGRSIFYYLAAMLAKTSVVMLPVILLLYIWWKRKRIAWPDVMRVAPYLAIAVALGLVTVAFQSHRESAQESSAYGFLPILTSAGESVFFYLGKFVWPVGLLPIYPNEPIDPPSIWQLASVPLLVAILAGLLTQRAAWGRHVLLGLGFFLLNLLPVLGLVGMAYMTISRTADHFVYLPMIGLVGLVVLGAEALIARLPILLRAGERGLIVAIIIILMMESHAYEKRFMDRESLWSYTLQRNPNASPARNDMGVLLTQAGRYPEAIAQLQEGLRENPGNAVLHLNLGIAFADASRLPEAKEQFEQSLQSKPDYDQAHNHLGIVLCELGRLPEGIAQFEEALRLNPSFAPAQENLAHAQSLLKAPVPAEK